MGATQRRLSILMLPWLAHGHISPYLELSKKLTERSFHIYFCSTPINLDSIKPKLSEKYSHSIQLPWAPSIAYTHNIPAVNFITTGAAMTCLALHAMKNPGEDFPFPELHLHDYMKARLTNSLEGSSTVHPYINDKERILQSFARSSNIVLIKTFRELEGKYIDLLSSLIEKKVVPVGPLVEDPVCEEEKAKTIDWLDKKKGP
ncbi:beta-d-glucosyl crocetin beta-1 [Quercus suber]|uniref:Beta-d-glucosyl crocetin beta-1 n=1 Tax=Quercus suber TaxID=58331 RepID=A0AAW0LN80_QUESU